jgi:UDP-N-acetylglucosamine transferase subunit ALG13
MIFITIGFQFSFDRLIKEMDKIAPALNTDLIIAQISKSNYEVKNMKSLDFVPPSEFNDYFHKAELIISHAGMGTIISALQCGTPIIVMPRLTKYREVKTDHQLATAKALEKLNYVHVVYDEKELRNKVTEVLNGSLKPLHTLGENASEELILSIKSFIETIKDK